MLAAGLLGLAGQAGAVDWTGRVSLLGSAVRPSAGDLGDDAQGTPTTDQQSLRLMAQGHDEVSEWSLHVSAGRQNLRTVSAAGPHASELFRWRRLADEHRRGDGVKRSTSIGWELDRAVVKRRLEHATLAFGRQPIDFGSGRFWQPLNVFGAFAPTDLDTDHKPGIDAAVLQAFPSPFSALTAVWAFAPRGQDAIDDSAALHYQRQVGRSSQLALLLARVIGRNQAGASFETDALGIGWRVEGLISRPQAAGRRSLFWIAGADYQFESGTLIALEWQHNDLGAGSQAALAMPASDRLLSLGLQQPAARSVLGATVQKDLTPLWNASATVLATALRSEGGARSLSLFSQISLVRSLGNESDLLLALSLGSGKGLDTAGRPRSAFGHLPPVVTLRWRTYF